MAVKTLLDAADLAHVTTRWGLGRIDEAVGIPQGSINTLYRLETPGGRLILRLSEGRAEEEVDFETRLLQHLAGAHFPCAPLRPTIDGGRFDRVQGRFACVFGFAAGESVRAEHYDEAMARESGRVLGRLHVVAESFPATLPNRNGPQALPHWLQQVTSGVARRNRADDAEVVEFLPELKRGVDEAQQLPGVAEGLIHADWFPDNLLWVGERLSAALDFEMACRGPYVLDLAIAIHAGCFGETTHDPARVRPFVEGYLSERKLTSPELRALPAWARFAALRFTTSRILDFHFSPLDASRLVKKDWRRFRDRYRATVALGDDGLRAAWGLGGV